MSLLPYFSYPFLLLFFPFSLSPLLSSPLIPHSLSLSSHQSHHRSHPHGNLLSNWPTTTTGSNACSGGWYGVDCFNNRVISLSLPSLNLRGPISSLSSLDQPRRLDLHNNRLNSSLSPLSYCSNLKLVYLSQNDFSGEIPPEFGNLRRLLCLDLWFFAFAGLFLHRRSR